MAQRLMLAVTLLATGAPAFAQGLVDPTRPPSFTAAPSDAAPATTGAQLQSVLISPHRRLAVINGQPVALGGHVGDATLTRITETGVVLKRGDVLETLLLLPGIAKKPAAPRANGEGKANKK